MNDLANELENYQGKLKEAKKIEIDPDDTRFEGMSAE